MPYQQHLDALNAEHQLRCRLLEEAVALGRITLLDEALHALEAAGFEPYVDLDYQIRWEDPALGIDLFAHVVNGTSALESRTAIHEIMTKLGAAPSFGEWVRCDARIKLVIHLDDTQGYRPARLKTQEAA